jgi:hypothetical protein
LSQLRPENGLDSDSGSTSAIRIIPKSLSSYSEGEGDGEDSLSDEDAAGEALGEGDASVLAFFFAGVGDAEEVPASFFFAAVEEVEVADVPVFFAVVAVVDFLAVVEALVVLLVVVADVSFLAQDARRPNAAETAIKENTNFFIEMLC